MGGVVAHLGGVVALWEAGWLFGRRGGSFGRRGGSMGGVVALGRRGGSIVVRQTVVLQSRVQIRRLPSPQLIDYLLVVCHLGWHLAAG